MRRRVVPAAVLSSLALVAGSLVVSVAPAAHAEVAGSVRTDDTAPADAPPADAPTADSETDAMAIAQQYGHAVTVDGEMTPTTEVDAQPDGTFEMTENALPVRVQQGADWVPVDTSLSSLGNGLLAPNASAAPVRFGDDGSNVLDKVQTPDGDWITETWPYGSLPVPTVSGSTATYADVLPGIDIRLTATASGMSNVLVVKSAQAAANNDLASLRLPVTGATVAAAAPDVMMAKASDGSTVVSASPVWWDSSDGSGATGPEGDAPAKPLEHTTDSSGLTMNIKSTVTAAGPTYPVYIDPDWSTGDNAYWFTDAAYPDQSYLNGNYADGIQSVGIGDGYQSDMFWQFPLSGVTGRVVQKATLNTTQEWAGSCSLTPIDVHVYGPQAAGFTWNQEQSWSGQWGGILQSQNPTAGCPGQGAAAVGWDVTSGVASYATASKSSIQFAFTYDNPGGYSRRHYAQGASLVIAYDSKPNTPVSLQLSSPKRGCGSAASPVIVNSRAEPITLSAMVKDADSGENTNAAFNIYTESDGAEHWSRYAGTGETNYTAQTVAKTLTFSAGTFDNATYPDGTEFSWRAIGRDSQGVMSGWSGYCYFRVDHTAPGPVTLATTATEPRVGSAFSVTLTPTTGSSAVGYVYWWAYSLTTSSAPPAPVQVSPNLAIPSCGGFNGVVPIACANGNSAVTVSTAPPDTAAVLWAAAYDAAGNIGTATHLDLGNVTIGSMDAITGHYWDIADDPDTSVPTIADSNTSSATDTTGEKDLTVGSGASWTSDTVIAPLPPTSALSFTGGTPTSVVSTTSAGVNTLSSFTVSAWVKPASATGTQAIVAQSGTSNSGFDLQEVGGKFQFCIQPQITGITPLCATAPAAAQLNTWQFVAGVWDTADHQVRLLVGNSVAPVAAVIHEAANADVTASGPVTVGSAKASGAAVNRWNGLISNVGLFPVVVDHDQLADLYNQLPPF